MSNGFNHPILTRSHFTMVNTQLLVTGDWS
jgi:hypothetical protein